MALPANKSDFENSNLSVGVQITLLEEDEQFELDAKKAAENAEDWKKNNELRQQQLNEQHNLEQ